MGAEQRIKELGLDLTHRPRPVANYVSAVRAGNLVFVSGHGPEKPDRTMVTGVVGRDIDEKQAYEAARLVAIQSLTSLRAEIGSLDRVRRIVKVLGMVNAAPDFKNHPAVINGFSDLMTEVFGDLGRHARSAVGMGSLPFSIPVEVEMIVEVEPE